MAEGLPPEEWDAARYEREKRSFVERRTLLRPISLHIGVILAIVGSMGWVTSRGLLALGVHSMPLRYAAGFVVAYLVFLLVVRAWADFMRRERDGTEWMWDVAHASNGEGCLLGLGMFLAGLVLAVFVTFFGGATLLLEVAFEVVFAGVVVRRLGRRHQVGDWAGRLVRGTWLPALAIGFALVILAAWLQRRAPHARTLWEALRAVLAQ